MRQDSRSPSLVRYSPLFSVFTTRPPSSDRRRHRRLREEVVNDNISLALIFADGARGIDEKGSLVSQEGRSKEQLDRLRAEPSY